MNALLTAARGVQTIASAPVGAVLLLKITAVLLAAWAIHLALWRANPRWRVLLWRATAAGLVVLPALGWLSPALEIHVEPPSVETAAARPSSSPVPPPADAASRAAVEEWSDPSPIVPTNLAEPVAHEIATPSIDVSPTARPEASPGSEVRARLVESWPAAILAVWIGGMAILALRGTIGHCRIGQMVRRAERTPSWVEDECLRVAEAVGCRSRVVVRRSALVRSPLLCGLGRPVLLLPPRMCEAAYRDDLPAIFAHELTHARFRDLVWNTGLHVVSIVLWFHPLAWRLRRAHLAACELVCDAVSANFVGNVNQYCRTLARIAVECAAIPSPAGLAMARTSSVSRRLNRLQRTVFHAPLRRWSVLAFCLASMMVVTAVGALRVAFSAPPQPATGQSAAPRSPAELTKGPEEKKPAVEPAKKPAARPIQVRVTDADRRPLADVTITVRMMANQPLGPIRYRTDQSGHASIDLPREDLTSLQLLVWDNKHVTVGAAWHGHGTKVQVPESYSFAMEQGTDFGGIVRDEAGKPAVGAEVNVEGRKTTPGDPFWVCINDTATTDAQGKWQVHRIPKDLAGFEFSVNVKRLAPASVERFPMKSLSVERLRAKTAEIVLRKGVVVEGTVTDPQGKPAVGAAVGLCPTPGLQSDSPRTKTDQNGHYRFAVFQPGDYTLAAAAKGYAPDSRDLTVGTEGQKVDLRLRKGEWVRVRVVDKAGKPMPQATVATVFDNPYHFALMLDHESALERDKDRHMLTDAEGRWSRLWIPNDALSLVVSKPGYAQVMGKYAPGDREHVVTLDAGVWTISGRVVNRETKAPVTKFRLAEGRSGLGQANETYWYQTRSLANTNGEYQVTWDRPDEHRVVRIEADGYYPSQAQPVGKGKKQVTFNVELEQGQDVTGVVRVSDGKPAAEADVVLCTPGRGLYLRNGRVDVSQLPLLARTGPDGRFAFPPQRDRFLLIAVHDRGIGQVRGEAGSKDIVLQPWARAEGTLLIAGKPAARETIKIDYNDVWQRQHEALPAEAQVARRIFRDYQTQTDEQGHFVFERVQPGKAKICHYVMLSREGMMSSWTSASSKSVEFAPGQTLSITLVGLSPAALRERHRDAKTPARRPAPGGQDDPARASRVQASLKVLTAQPAASQDERIDAALAILRDYEWVGKDEGVWAAAVRELITIGKPAIPKLIAELDRAQRHQTLRALGFVLRGIGDPRAVPALIRAIPRLYAGSGSDFGLRVANDPALTEFMKRYSTDAARGGELFSFGRPIREIMTALEKITGQSHGWMEYIFAEFNDTGPEQERIKRLAFLKLARRWAEWWSTNWNKHVAGATEAEVGLIQQSLDREAESIAEMPHLQPAMEVPFGSRVVVSGGASNHRVQSFDESAWEAFLDFDTGRRPNPPPELAKDAPGGEPSKELLAWAEQEGVDLIVVKVRLPGSKDRVYAFKPVGMKVWRIDNDRFDNLQNELVAGDRKELPTPWIGLVAQLDEKSGKYDDQLTASFLFVTKEGTCGALQIQSPISPTVRPGMPVGNRGGWTYRFIYERSPEPSPR